MKIIHTADIHLGSRFRGLLTEEKGEERRRELRSVFSRLVEYARSEQIDNILISGDLFDSALPSKKDRELFYNTVRRHDTISFYYLKGNHDISEIGDQDENIPNLHRFSDEWTSYDLGEGVILTGIEATDENISSKYGTLVLDSNKKNIVMMHGAIGGGESKDGIDLRKLSGKNIDYLALGHYHSYSFGKIDSRGRYVYSGCLEGRGFDECGEKGFCVIDSETLSEHFIPFACRNIREYEIDISGLCDAFEISDRIKKEINCPEKDLVRIILRGEILYSLGNIEKDIEDMLCGRYYYVNIIDKTRRTVVFRDIENEMSLAGEFVRAVRGRDDLSDQQKNSVITVGLRALKGDKEII